MSSVRIPSDIDRDDKILAGLSARQLAIVAAPAVVLWGIYMITQDFLPPMVFVVAAVVVGAASFTFAVGQRDGISLDRLALAAILHHRGSKKYVPADDDLDLPAGITALGLAPEGVDSDGIVDLGKYGKAIIGRVLPVNLSLQAESEQIATANGFARFCNSTDSDVQIVIRATRINLQTIISELEERAPSLPDVRLEGAAVEHARFLQSVAGRSDLWTRQMFMVFREPSNDDATAILRRRLDDATSLLRPCNVAIHLLDQTAVELLLREAADPESMPVSGVSIFDDSIITEAQ